MTGLPLPKANSPQQSYMYVPASLKTIVCTGLVCACVLPASFQASAQEFGDRQRPSSFGTLSGFNLNPLQSMTQLSRLNEIAPMEGAVDAERYIVGPGDVFDVSIGGPRPIMTQIPVSADGHLLLPEAGAVDVAGRRLAEARRMARLALQEEFENVRVEATLAQPRQFYVHISGAIPVPGRYVATPVARVATVINMAFLDTLRTPVANPDLRPALRNIKLIHRDGSSERIDLLKYYSTGETSHNPYLNDGDVISVPTFNPNYDAVFVSGEVAFPGAYDHRPDDSVYDLLVLATGEDPPRGFTKVRVLRARGDGRTTSEIHDVAALDGSVKVDARDQVHALQNPTVRGSASIEGRVQYPGTYSVVPGETTVMELLDMAGGLREDALARGASLQRATLPPPKPQTERRNRFELSTPEFDLFRTDSLAMFQNTRLARMDYISRAYLTHELYLQNSVPLDLSELSRSNPVYVQDGDRVVVPRDENSVFVLGQVNRPGYVPHQPGASFQHYIEASGGLSDNAGDAFVIEAGTGRYADALGTSIESGDKIFINRAEPRADTAELQRLLMQDRRADLDERSRTVQNIVSSIGAATAVITTYLLIRRN